MKMPPLLLAAALLFWGWQNEMLLWGAAMAVALEGSRVVRARWELSKTDLNRIWDLSALLVLGLAVILYSAEERMRFGFKFAQWLPFPFFPIMLAQVYGNWEKIPTSVFSWFVRRSPSRSASAKSYNISFIYFCVCLFAAGASNRSNPIFYWGLALLATLALLTARPQRLSRPTWIACLALVSVTGYFGHQQLTNLQTLAESAFGNWIVRFFHRETDLRESRTSIGEIGRHKLSGKIVWRVETEDGSSPPNLLREASYDFYRAGVWKSSAAQLSTVSVDTNDVVILQPPKKLKFNARIAGFLSGGRGLLPLPQGAFELDDLPVALQTNRLGVARVSEGPGLINFLAYYGPGKSCDEPPADSLDAMDRNVPESEAGVLEQLVGELKLREKKSEMEMFQTISHFFQSNFTYSLNRKHRFKIRPDHKTALGEFLTETRSGHCEYFASATVLLLRQAGIPARYAVGYAVPESTHHGNKYIIRERHAHAWTLVWRQEKGCWEEFDTTPASWDGADNMNASSWEAISDFFSNVAFQFSKWRYSKTSYTQYLQWLLAPLILFLAWRILSGKRRKRSATMNESEIAETIWPGRDSEFYLIERKLSATGLGRFPNESFSYWQERVDGNLPQAGRLAEIISLHRRLRFDPRGLTTEDRHLLKLEAERWLAEFESLQPSQTPRRNRDSAAAQS